MTLAAQPGRWGRRGYCRMARQSVDARPASAILRVRESPILRDLARDILKRVHRLKPVVGYFGSM
jgi:hypothetical protein